MRPLAAARHPALFLPRVGSLGLGG